MILITVYGEEGPAASALFQHLGLSSGSPLRTVILSVNMSACLRYSPWGGKESGIFTCSDFSIGSHVVKTEAIWPVWLRDQQRKKFSFSPISQLIVWTPLTTSIKASHLRVLRNTLRCPFCHQAVLLSPGHNRLLPVTLPWLGPCMPSYTSILSRWP